VTGTDGIVYVLVDPRNDLIRYVGSTTRPLGARLSEHLHAAREGEPSPVAGWLREAQEAGVRVEARPLLVVPVRELLAVERATIEDLYDGGWPLTNVRDCPGAPHALNAGRKLAAARARVARLAGIGGPLLEEAHGDVAQLTAHLRQVDALAAELAAPTDEAGIEPAVRRQLAAWDDPRAPLAVWEVDVLASVLTDVATVGHRRGVPFTHVMAGIGVRMLQDVRAGHIALQRALGSDQGTATEGEAA
jgi:hypothetical protein